MLLGGIAVATAVRRVLLALAKRREDVDAPDFVAQLAYYVIVVVATTLAAEQAAEVITIGRPRTTLERLFLEETKDAKKE